MAKDKVKDKKEKKEKRSEVDGVKKSKKEKKSKVNGDVVDALEEQLAKEPEVEAGDDAPLRDIPASALVPIAVPLCDDTKEVKKVLKSVKKCKQPLSLTASFRVEPVTNNLSSR